MNLIKTINYQSLVCLGVMSKDSPILLQMQQDKEQIKLAFLRDFLQLDSDISTLEEKVNIMAQTNVNLFASGTNYNTEKARLITAITNTVNLHKGFIQNFETTYMSKIAQFSQDVIDYTRQNSGVV